MKNTIIGLIIYYAALCFASAFVSKVSYPILHCIIDTLLKSGPYVAAIVSLGIAFYVNRPKKQPILKFSIATVPTNTTNSLFFSQQYTANSQNMVRLICSNESDVLAEDVTVELVSIDIPSPLNWTHQNQRQSILRCGDERKILPHQKAYLDLLETDQNGAFQFSSKPIYGTQYAKVPSGKQTLKMVYHTKNGIFGEISIDLDNNGNNTTLTNLLQK